MVADYRDTERLSQALTGIEQVYLIGPTDPPQVTHEADVIEVARQTGVRCIVKQPAMNAHDMSACTFKRWNGMVERPYTILRPTGFMQNFVNYDSARIAAEGVLHSPRREAQVSWIDVRDIAAVAVAVLTEEGHDGRAYDLTGPEALSDKEIAAKLSAAAGREIRCEPLSDANWFLLMRSRGLPASTVRSMLSLHLAYRAESPGLVTGWVEVLSGQVPRSFDDFAHEYADRFKGPQAA